MTVWESFTNAELRVSIEMSEKSAATARGTRDVSQADSRAHYAREAEQARRELARRHELPDGHDIRVGPGTIQVLARASVDDGWHWFEVASTEEACHALELHALAAANGEGDGIVELPDGHDIRVEPNSIEIQVRGSRGIDVKMRGKWLEVATDIDACEILSELAREAKEEGRATEASGAGLAEGAAVGAVVGALLLGPVGLVVGAAAGAMLGGREAVRSSPSDERGAFLGSEFAVFENTATGLDPPNWKRIGTVQAATESDAKIAALSRWPSHQWLLLRPITEGADDAVRSSPSDEDPLALLEAGAFLRSDFFPIRIGDRIDVTEEQEGESVVVATVRLREGAIVVKGVGTGKQAVANAKRVARLFEPLKKRKR